MLKALTSLTSPDAPYDPDAPDALLKLPLELQQLLFAAFTSPAAPPAEPAEPAKPAAGALILAKVERGVRMQMEACLARACSNPPDPRFSCQTCGAKFCSKGCLVQEDDRVCKCLVQDQLLLRDPGGSACLRLLGVASHPPSLFSLSDVWTTFDCCPGAVLSMKELLTRWGALDTLAALDASNIVSALANFSFLGTLPTTVLDPEHQLPPHLVEAAEFAREMLLRHAALVACHPGATLTPPNIRAVVYSYVHHIIARGAVDPRMVPVLPALVRRIVDGGGDGGGGGAVIALVSALCANASAPVPSGFWEMLRDIVIAYPSSARAFFADGLPAVDSLLRECISPLLRPLVYTVLDVGAALLHDASLALVGAAAAQPPDKHWSPSRALQSFLGNAGAATATFLMAVEAVPDAPQFKNTGRLYHDLVGVLSSIQLCKTDGVVLLAMHEALKCAQLLGGVAMAGGDAAQCATAAALIASVAVFQFVVAHILGDMHAAHAVGLTRHLVRTLDRGNVRTGAVFPFGFETVVSNLLLLAPSVLPGASVTVQLARRVGRNLPVLGRAVSAEMVMSDDSLFTRRLRGILEGAPRLCEGPGCGAKGAETALQLCSRCRGARYCGRECQRAHRAVHAQGGACAPRECIELGMPGRAFKLVPMFVHAM